MSLTSTTQTTDTTLPSWYSTAQQNTGTAAQNALTAAQNPANNTVNANTVANYGGASTPFTEATGNLGKIQSGLMNPYDANGNPNTSSPLGALFSAQNTKLDQILPQVTAKEGAMGLGGGNFGSLRGQTATGTARAGALTTLSQEQHQAALNAMTQATQAATAEGQVGSQGVASGIDLGKMQSQGGLDALTKYENIMGAMAPTLDKKSTQTNEGSSIENASKLGALAASLGMTAAQLSDAYKGTSSLPWMNTLFKSGSGVLSNLFGDSTPNTTTPVQDQSQGEVANGYWDNTGNWVEGGSANVDTGGSANVGTNTYTDNYDTQQG